ncbi:MAG TPA: hypothetical protein VFR37_19440 [Longimicrobium sp.]|nr:hypothetical protein [Longimicrobium sp.]
MKKLLLKLDDLRVDTFTTAEQRGVKGTVQGHYGTAHTQPIQQTCDVSCDVTCEYTCDGYGTIPPGQAACVWC